MDFAEYYVENARQFWAELEDILMIPSSASLNRIDSALRTFVNFCSTYHEQYLHETDQLEHAVALLLDSDLFAFHSDRSSEQLTSAAHTETNPHALLVIYSVLLHYGRRHPAFFGAAATIPSQQSTAARIGMDALTPMVPQGKRSAGHKRWQGLIPLLMDHVRWGVDDLASGVLGVPIEARLRLVCVRLLYEVCRVQKLDAVDLKVFDDSFIEHLFETIEDTRCAADETLNYYLIKLIVALNEQFMVASLIPHKPSKAGSDAGTPTPTPSPQSQTFLKPTHQRAPSADRPPNRVLEILMRRLYSSQTFGANIIFMLNRAENTPEDLCMQLLLLKMLYLLFTTPGTHEYFYTNDLRVLVDVFIRELTNLPEESESLRHTYLRVLHPLVTNTQLKTTPYKRPELRSTLISLVAHSHIRDVNPTTKRLVERCLAAEWSKALGSLDGLGIGRSLSAKASSADLIARLTVDPHVLPRSASAEPVLRSLDRLKLADSAPGSTNGSTSSLTDVAGAPPPHAVVKPVPPIRQPRKQNTDPSASTPPLSPSRSSTYSSASEPASGFGLGSRAVHGHGGEKFVVLRGSDVTGAGAGAGGERRKAPSPPTQRRKPPAVPVRVPKIEIGHGGTTITTIASSSGKHL
ncbi:hypothetical protein FRC09_000990 [Ceratobasidium sp. 395]|nr:hypothetical protein FRC09_000990 [Ceratobasidium sp. 395]